MSSFNALVKKVKETFILGRKRVREEMARTYWQTGKYIHAHILLHKDRADYGKQIIPNLAVKSKISQDVLWDSLRIYREFPLKILGRVQELPVRVLRRLATIEDKTLRGEFIERAIEGNWTGEQLQSKIKIELRGGSKNGGAEDEDESKSAGIGAVAPDYSLITRPKLGILYTYRIIEHPRLNPPPQRRRKEEGVTLKIDQGFNIYRNEFQTGARFKAGEAIESLKTKDGNYKAVRSSRTAEDLFTYKAYVERVIDADTLFVEIDLGFTNTTRQYLRLRAIDAPELDTALGRKAKDFVVKAVKEAPFIILTSTRDDKYRRYLADVFIPGPSFLKSWEKGTAVLDRSEDLLFLNNELLKRKFAVRMKG